MPSRHHRASGHLHLSAAPTTNGMSHMGHGMGRRPRRRRFRHWPGVGSNPGSHAPFPPSTPGRCCRPNCDHPRRRPHPRPKIQSRSSSPPCLPPRRARPQRILPSSLSLALVEPWNSRSVPPTRSRPASERSSLSPSLPPSAIGACPYIRHAPRTHRKSPSRSSCPSCPPQKKGSSCKSCSSCPPPIPINLYPLATGLGHASPPHFAAA
jgi:hypothetical protein